jgi:hypothetical protein
MKPTNSSKSPARPIHASFTVTVADFRNVLKDKHRFRSCHYRLSQNNAPKGTRGNSKKTVRLTHPDGSHSKNTIAVDSDRASLHFKVVSKNLKDSYLPFGIAVVTRSVSRKKRPSTKAAALLPAVAPNEFFPRNSMSVSPARNTISIHADFSKIPAHHTKRRYKIFIAIQCLKSGEIGIIDPPVDHPFKQA